MSEHKKALELLGTLVDLSVKYRAGLKAFQCVHCEQRASTPPKVQHSHNCIVAQAADFLNKTRT